MIYSFAAGILIWLGLATVILIMYLRENVARLYLDRRRIVLLAVILAGVAGLNWLIMTWHWPGAGYFLPIALGPMLIAMMLDSSLGILSAGLLATVVGLLTHSLDNSWHYSLVALIGGITGVFSVNGIRTRNDFVRAGLAVGSANALAILSLSLLSTGLTLATGVNALIGLFTGIMAAMLAAFCLSFLEDIFKVTTNIKLLEIGDLNSPLLKNLLLKAPGSYHHGFIVGNLAESAARAIDANALLARVGCYYHDIGKTLMPGYFIENQAGINKHDNLTPQMSSLILISHVKDGVALAEENKLPPSIVDFIAQHHGTCLISHFYQQALEEDKTASDERYRYPGPKPQSRETAIAMLADSVEAASRALSRRSPGQIEEVVKQIIDDRFIDGQFDECSLTLKDLHKIGESLTRDLTGILHSRAAKVRIGYIRQSHGNRNKKQNPDKITARPDKKNRRPGLEKMAGSGSQPAFHGQQDDTPVKQAVPGN